MCQLGPQIKALWVLFQIEELFKSVTTPSFISSKIQEQTRFIQMMRIGMWGLIFTMIILFLDWMMLNYNMPYILLYVCSRRVEILAIVAKKLPFCTHTHLITTSRVILFLKPRICRFFSIKRYISLYHLYQFFSTSTVYFHKEPYYIYFTEI